MKKSKKYYFCGITVLILSICVSVFGMTMPLIDQNKTYLGWIGFGVTIGGVLLMFFSIYLCYKAKFLKNKNK